MTIKDEIAHVLTELGFSVESQEDGLVVNGVKCESRSLGETVMSLADAGVQIDTAKVLVRPANAQIITVLGGETVLRVNDPDIVRMAALMDFVEEII